MHIAVGFIFVALAIIIGLWLLLIATPVVLLIFFGLTIMIASHEKRKLKGTLSDFWLKQDEKSRFKFLHKELQAATLRVEQAKRAAETEGISKNKDGSWSRRSRLGKQIMEILESDEPKIRTYEEEIQKISATPQTRWSSFSAVILSQKAFGLAFFGWLGVMLFYSIGNNEGISGITRPYLALMTNIFRDESARIATAEGDFIRVLISTGTAIVCFVISVIIFHNDAQKYTPKPMLVTIENVDEFKTE